jgi:hypothetical protein
MAYVPTKRNKKSPRLRPSRLVLKTRFRGPTLAVGLIGWALLGIPSQARGQDSSLDEYQVKLGFLYNFSKFVEWPEQAFPAPNSPLVIGIVGSDPFGKELENDLSTRATRGHPIVLKRLSADGDLTACHILFIRAEERRHLAGILARLKGRAILTVGETPGFLDRGGHIDFVFVDKSLGFEVNRAATQQTPLKLSAKLLTVAKSMAGR